MKVSVCIPTYNQSAYLEQAIQSAAKQSHTPLEIIVADDCSTDDTSALLAKLAAEIPFLKVIRQCQNVGIMGNTDACLRQASGDFIVRLDSDDYLSPDYIEKLGQQLLKFPKAGYAHAAVQEIDHAGAFLQHRKLFRKSGPQASNEALRSMLKGYRVAANIIMFKQEALATVNYVSGRPTQVEDYSLASAICAAGYDNVYLDETLAFYRVWETTGHARRKRKLTEITGLQRVFEEVLEPAYRQRGWEIKDVLASKTQLACKHANCLAWDIYDETEKKELLAALQKLSSTSRAQLIYWLYLNGLGKPINIVSNVEATCKSYLKGSRALWPLVRYTK
ncbi:glycosyltransferase family 2 protein [Hymenobacter radiodurans]|uniref:glycosyltransferase family 2 protein n=1 Tax=Hymenobacter radiodurans TaxID=2496028 RepID=UPI0010583B68|nr:glycosyltransferase family 2 protein [Hymenobacter radiodurans]